MINKTTLLDIVSGRRRGFAANAMRGFLWAMTPIYRFGVGRRNRKFETDTSKVAKIEVPVISIGNLTTGGTGKTPLVIWLCQHIRSLGQRVAIVSRGYGADSNREGVVQQNDEAMELEQRLPDVPHLQDPDRVATATIAIEELETQCIVMDDGFQHRRLGRDLDIIVVDATEPFGYGWLLPRGLLREPIANIARADFVIISRCDQVSTKSLQQTRATILQHDPSMKIATTKVQPELWMQYDGQQQALESLAKQPVYACCAIGNPDSFYATLSQVASNTVGQKNYPDHHLFTRDDINSIVETAKSAGAQAIVCTHKDLVKIGVNQLMGLPIYALVTGIVFTDGEQELKTVIQSTLTP